MAFAMLNAEMLAVAASSGAWLPKIITRICIGGTFANEAKPKGHIIHNAVVPPVVIEELQSEGKSHAVKQGLTLPEHTTELRIAYTALSLGIPERVAFRYRLQGVDADWQDAGNRREAFYTQLSPGDYLFEVRASDEANAFRHAQASRIDVELSHGDDELRLRVRDDGSGMDADVLAAGHKPGHWGLTGMRERAEQIGAVLAMRSRPGAGTGTGTELELRLSAARAYRSKPEQGRRGLRFLINRAGEFEA